MKIRKWWLENLAVVGVLVAVTYWQHLPLTWKTLGWALGVLVVHSLHSHGIRKAEDAGKPIDWLTEFFVGLGGVAVLLGADDAARVLVSVPVVRQLVFIVWRFGYRRWWKSLVTSWSRADD